MNTINKYLVNKQAEYESSWNYYKEERAVLHGLPLSAICCVAYAAFAKRPGLTTAFLFGAVHWMVFTPLNEGMRQHNRIDTTRQIFLFTFSYFVSQYLLRTFFMINIGHAAALPLACAAIGGQMLRYCFAESAF